MRGKIAVESLLYQRLKKNIDRFQIMNISEVGINNEINPRYKLRLNDLKLRLLHCIKVSIILLNEG